MRVPLPAPRVPLPASRVFLPAPRVPLPAPAPRSSAYCPCDDGGTIPLTLR
jgi:hypothetical protein